MKTWSILLVALLAVSTRAADVVKFDVQLDEPAGRPQQAIRWPITVGVPFAAGAIQEQTPVALFDSTGKPVPLQTKVIGHWFPKPGTPQWVLLDYQANFNGGQPPAWTVRTGIQPPLEHVPADPLHAEATPSSGLKVNETAGKITVDTGAVSFTVDRNHFSLFDTFQAAGAAGSAGPAVLDGSSMYWIDEQGRRYEAKAYGQSKVEVELKGAMRTVIKADGWYAPNDAPAGAKPMMIYQVRIAAFAGLPYVRVYHTFIWTADDKIKMKEWGLSFHLAKPAATGKIGLDNGSAIGGTLSAKALAGVELTHEKTPRLAGWAQAGNLGVALMDMSSQLPKAYALYNDRVDVQLWAPQAGLLSMNVDDRTLSPKTSEADREWLTNNQVPSPQGVAKTHELWVWPIGQNTPPAQVVNDYVQRPPVAMADPVYQGSTDAITGLRAAADTPKQYQFMEDAMNAMFQTIAAPEDRCKDFDMYNFGAVHLFSPAGWRGYDDNGYNWSQAPWKLFYRSGKREYFMHGVRNARNVMDEAVCNYATPDGGGDPLKRVGFKAMYSPLIWGWGPFGDNFHTHPQYLMYYYDMTGYERAADVLHLQADAGNGGPPNPAQYPMVSRSQYGAIDPKCQYYFFTGEESYVRQAAAWAHLAMSRRDAQGHFTHNNFWYFFHRGLWDTWRITGDQSVLDSVVSQVKDFAEAPTNSLAAPHWDRNSLLAFYVAYAASHNEQYLDYPIHRLIDELHAVQTQGPVTPWVGGRGYTAMDRNEYGPFFDWAPEMMGAWHDTGFKALPAWPGNYPFMASHPVKEKGFQSCMTLYVKKAAGAAGTLALSFQPSNLTKFEDLDKGQKKMEAWITGPDGARRVVPASLIYQPATADLDPYHQPPPIRFDAADPAGVYRVEIMGRQQLFYMAPRTDMPGLVVEQADRDISYKFRDEPARIYFKLLPGVRALTIKYFGANRRNLIRPLRITDLDDATLGYMTVDGPQTLTVPIPVQAQGKPLSLAAGISDFSPYDMNLMGVKLEGAQAYFSTQPQQWFDPKAAR